MSQPPAAPPPSSAARHAPALARLEADARRELAQWTAALPPPQTPDPLLATLAWDLGLGGERLPE